MTNTLKTTALLAALTALLVLIGDYFGGQGGMLLFFGLAVVMSLSAYWFSGDIALRMAGAREVSEQEAPELHQLVAELATYARLPKPRVAIIDNPSPNAFATGRDANHAVVAVTTGILGILNRDELAGVLAHELGHVRNHDILISSIAATIAGAITMLAQAPQWAMLFGGFGGSRDDGEDNNTFAALLMIIVAPIAAMLIQLAISRAREYAADETGAARKRCGAQRPARQVPSGPLHLRHAGWRHGRQLAARLDRRRNVHPVDPAGCRRRCRVVRPTCERTGSGHSHRAPNRLNTRPV